MTADIPAGKVLTSVYFLKVVVSRGKVSTYKRLATFSFLVYGIFNVLSASFLATWVIIGVKFIFVIFEKCSRVPAWHPIGYSS